MSKILAKVNGKNIYKSFLDRMLFEFLKNKDEENKIDKFKLDKYKTRMLEKLIDRALLVSYSEKMGINVNFTEMNETFISTSENEPVLVSEKFNIYNEEGYEDAQQEVIKQKLIYQLNAESDETEYGEDTVKKFYENNKYIYTIETKIIARHIFVSTEYIDNKSDYDKAKNKIQNAYDKLKKGVPFEEVAKTYSECPSKDNGGNLGHIRKGQLGEEFDNVVFNLEKNTLSEIFESDYGLHIVEVTAVDENQPIPYEEVKTGLAQQIKEERVKYNLDKLLEELRDKSNIEIFSL
jgi:peptidyl-prolyl cis-trans isomerase C